MINVPKKFVGLSADVHISCNCKVGAFSFLVNNTMVLSNITIGRNVIVSVHSVVTKKVPNNPIIVGISTIIKKNNHN